MTGSFARVASTAAKRMTIRVSRPPAQRILVLGIMIFSGPLTSAVSSAQTSRPAVVRPSDVRGISWSDPRDNYNPAQIVPAHLSLDSTPQQARQVADGVAERALALGANTVRLGINPPTVADPRWWPVYREAILELARRNVCVLLCAWEQSPTVSSHGRSKHDGRFGAGTVDTYAAMWAVVYRAFADESNVIGYELLNEPFGFRGHRDEYVAAMTRLMKAVGPHLNGKHFLVAGIGYSDDVRTIAPAFPQKDVWFAYHVYPNWFGGEAGQTVLSRQNYADEIASRLLGVEDRTVITEFGCWGGPGFDYSRPANDQSTLGARRHVGYLQGVADACARLKLGSVYWFGDAREPRTHDAYDLFADDGKVFEKTRADQVRRAWGLPPLPAQSP